MAPKSKDQNPSGLGRAIINRKANDARRQQESGLYTTDLDPTSKLKSVTHEGDLQEFLNTAQLAGTQFTAERRNVKIIPQSTDSVQNRFILTDQEENAMRIKHLQNKKRLRVPRRPHWTKSTTPQVLDRQERDAFLQWRRDLAHLQDDEKFLLTPFERNLEVWRQLWRVLERSHLVVQIVDARNPLNFRCEDLEDYALQLDDEQGAGKGKRRCLLLINKADLLNVEQRRQWADYLDREDVQYAFYSAANAAALQGTPLANASLVRDVDEETFSDEEASSSPPSSPSSSDHSLPEEGDDRIRILSVAELESLFLRVAPPLSDFATNQREIPDKLVVGLVGYPNVGKSSTINSLLGAKAVSVSSTPGKTKHFQTVHLSDSIILCDCPGLVFPQFATTKAALVCDGVLPIDQMREYIGPVALVVKRIPKAVLEATYGLKLATSEEHGNEEVTAETLLTAYAVARGYTRSGQGNPDEARAARYILKDYVNAKLLFCHPPPGVSEQDFNGETHEDALRTFSKKKTAPSTRVGKNADTFLSEVTGSFAARKTARLDEEFFLADGVAASAFVGGEGYTRSRSFPHQNMTADDGTPRTAMQARIASVLATQNKIYNGKKNHKKPKRVKQRSGKGYD